MNANLRAHQLLLLEMLKEVDKICKKHDISYSLFAGSALGAIRHQGFSPWDDDLDIVMLRKDYERFLAIAETELDPEQYFLQKEFSEHWPMFFSKLRKNGTACIERQRPKDRLMHQGIYIDIFPCDNLSDHGVVRKLTLVGSTSRTSFIWQQEGLFSTLQKVLGVGVGNEETYYAYRCNDALGYVNSISLMFLYSGYLGVALVILFFMKAWVSLCNHSRVILLLFAVMSLFSTAFVSPMMVLYTVVIAAGDSISSWCDGKERER